MNREKFGIKGVDSMIEFGLPKGSIIGLSGPPGVGKSILTLHFLLEGAKKGQKCVYINLEEPRSNINNMINQFSFSKEFNTFINEDKIVIKCYNYIEYEKIYSEIFDKINEDKNISRLVIDSFNCFFSSVSSTEITNLSTEVNIRKMINHAFSMLRKKNLTSLLILEKPNGISGFYYNIPHLVDGMINLDFIELGTIERRIFIPKMRWTNQYKDSKSFEISEQGITVTEEKE